MRSVSSGAAAVKHLLRLCRSKIFDMLNADTGTICAFPEEPALAATPSHAGSSALPCFTVGVTMIAKLLLLIALLAPILTVAAGILAHRKKEPERDGRDDTKST